MLAPYRIDSSAGSTDTQMLRGGVGFGEKRGTCTNKEEGWVYALWSNVFRDET